MESYLVRIAKISNKIRIKALEFLVYEEEDYVFLNFIFNYILECTWECHAGMGQKKTWDLLELELQGVISCFQWCWEPDQVLCKNSKHS